MTDNRKTVAVLFGGVSPEHDVSILTGLQIIEAIDSSAYQAIPIYIDQNGEWFYGKELLNRKNYHFSSKAKASLDKIGLKLGRKFNKRPYFIIENKSLFGKNKKISFDIALLALHGGAGENGQIQSAFAVANIPYTGCDNLSASIFMNKSLTKSLFKSSGIKVLEEIVVNKPKIDESTTKRSLIGKIDVKFPACVKPCNLGSSIGVKKVINNDELYSSLLEIFKLDDAAIIEPFIDNLVEYNISVTKALNNKVEVSAIEKPVSDEELLSFEEKYLASDEDLDNKLTCSFSEGMASASRILNPDITKEQKEFIESNAKAAFSLLNASGAPRIDFLCNKKTGEIWLNEINPLPGSLGYYLWEARIRNKVNFTQLLTKLIEEGFNRPSTINNQDLKSFNAAIFPQR